MGIECTCNEEIKNNIITYLRKNEKFIKLEKSYQNKKSIHAEIISYR